MNFITMIQLIQIRKFPDSFPGYVKTGTVHDKPPKAMTRKIPEIDFPGYIQTDTL